MERLRHNLEMLLWDHFNYLELNKNTQFVREMRSRYCMLLLVKFGNYYFTT